MFRRCKEMEARGRFKGLMGVGTIIYFVALLVLTVYVAMQSSGLILNFITLVFGYLWVFSIIYLLLKRASG
jgi:hypothetical protein